MSINYHIRVLNRFKLAYSLLDAQSLLSSSSTGCIALRQLSSGRRSCPHAKSLHVKKALASCHRCMKSAGLFSDKTCCFGYESLIS